MSDKPWKQFERDCAALINGKRFWSNSGERLDVESDAFRGQCKLVQRMSLAELTKLAEEMAKDTEKFGVVFTKLRAGKGRKTPILVTMTAEEFRSLIICYYKENNDRPAADPGPDPVLPSEGLRGGAPSEAQDQGGLDRTAAG